MKLVHISDIHIHPEPILGHDPVGHFRECLASIEENDRDADMVVITGDLTHAGFRESYEDLRRILEGSGLQGRLAPRLLVGNHDHRASFRTVFPDAADDGNGFVQWTEATEAGLFVFMDSVDEGFHSGRYCARRRAWLEHVLAGVRAERGRAFLFMHHNPAATHVPNADTIGFADEAELQALIAKNRDVIAYMFFGHCHYTLSGIVHGVPFAAPRSTNHACWPDFAGPATRMGYGALAPNYNVCFLKPETTIIHSIDFMDRHKVLWRHDPE